MSHAKLNLLCQYTFTQVNNWLHAAQDSGPGVVLSATTGTDTLMVARFDLASTTSPADSSPSFWSAKRIVDGLTDTWHIFSGGYHWITFEHRQYIGVIVLADATLATVAALDTLLAFASDSGIAANDHFLVPGHGTRGPAVVLCLADFRTSGGGLLRYQIELDTTGAVPALRPVIDLGTWVPGAAVSIAAEGSGRFDAAGKLHLLIPTDNDPSVLVRGKFNHFVVDNTFVDGAATPAEVVVQTIGDGRRLAAMATWSELSGGYFAVTYRLTSDDDTMYTNSAGLPQDGGQVVRLVCTKGYGVTDIDLLHGSSMASSAGNRPHTMVYHAGGKRNFLVTAWQVVDDTGISAPYCMLRVDMIETAYLEHGTLSGESDNDRPEGPGAGLDEIGPLGDPSVPFDTDLHLSPPLDVGSPADFPRYQVPDYIVAYDYLRQPRLPWPVDTGVPLAMDGMVTANCPPELFEMVQALLDAQPEWIQR